MKKYSAYKDSGIEWLGEIPEHWESLKLKWISKIYGGSTPSSSKMEYWNGDINWVTTDDLGKLKNKFITTTERKITLDGLNSIGKSLTPKGALVISNRAPIGHIGILAVDAATNQGCKSIVLNQEVNSVYYYYLLLTTKDALDSLGRGTTFKELSTQALNYFIVSYPSISEQTAIANFLDHKTRQIDELITKKERLIELLKEERTAIINHAVTKGLDPKVPMKDSGIEWLGEIPEHWEILRLKFTAKLLVSNVDKKINNNELKVRLCNYTDVYNHDVIHESINFMQGSASKAEMKKFILREGDVIITKDSETPNDIAIPAYIPTNYDDIICSYHLAIIRYDNGITGKYLFYLFKSFRFNQQFTVAARGITRFGLSQSSISNAYLPIPSIHEQTAIVNFLDDRIKQTDEQITNIEKEIDLIKEYKTSLINEAVTGKIDVRDYKMNHVTT